MVTPHKSVISVYCQPSQKFYPADGFSNTIKIFPFHSEKKETSEKKDFKRLYTNATFNAHKMVPNSLVKSVVSVKLFKN